MVEKMIKHDSTISKKKKTEPLPKDYFICQGCNRKTNVYWETPLGNRCVKCVVNYQLYFYWETEQGKRELVKAKWTMNEQDIYKIHNQENENVNYPALNSKEI
jgi:hypothetical protein